MNDIMTLLENFQYFNGWHINDINLIPSTNEAEIILKNNKAEIQNLVKIRFINIDIFEWDNTKFNIIANNRLNLEDVNCVFHKKEDREIFDRIEFMLSDNRKLKIRYRTFWFEDISNSTL